MFLSNAQPFYPIETLAIILVTCNSILGENVVVCATPCSSSEPTLGCYASYYSGQTIILFFVHMNVYSTFLKSQNWDSFVISWNWKMIDASWPQLTKTNHLCHRIYLDHFHLFVLLKHAKRFILKTRFFFYTSYTRLLSYVIRKPTRDFKKQMQQGDFVYIKPHKLISLYPFKKIPPMLSRH